MEEIDLARLNKWFDEELVADKWCLEYKTYEKEKERTREALLSIGNGYFGTRGTHEEMDQNSVNQPGTYMGGVFNRIPSQVGDRQIWNEDFVNCPNWLSL